MRNAKNKVAEILHKKRREYLMKLYTSVFNHFSKIEHGL